nr:MAG TPA: primosome assembly protein PriA [Caudoviricetes sp.]
MYVGVKFYRESAQGYVGRAYSYETELPLNIGDRVVVPAGSGKNRAIVTEINVPQEHINPDYFPLKRITEYDEPEVEG